MEDFNLLNIIYILCIMGIVFHKKIFTKFNFNTFLKILFWIGLILVLILSRIVSFDIPFKILTTKIATKITKKIMEPFVSYKFKEIVKVYDKDNEHFFIAKLLDKDSKEVYLVANPSCKYLKDCFIDTKRLLLLDEMIEPSKEIFTRRTCKDLIIKDIIMNSYNSYFNDNNFPDSSKKGKLEIIDLKDASKGVEDMDYGTISEIYRKNIKEQNLTILNHCEGKFAYFYDGNLSNMKEMKYAFDVTNFDKNKTLISGKVTATIVYDKGELKAMVNYFDLEKLQKLEDELKKQGIEISH
ncbi:putative membrane protein [Campylobacter blaseri]|uniref:Uncharacterized protein n=1 Tax=Campylobacter blaseri TaxID=2042961 RepID=A0A2P8R3G5_9BACT|nr:hypothetical protein [Campylobacter blaseri]PSM53038.1 hypothetical protein CQ405_00340 [Campylobacter blaseri]PSM54505.1 hypothetical protein CRN67_00340 [Campylobacter blaseri]QKF85247.1 putative membrane protein [Campylobacter blaseri]